MSSGEQIKAKSAADSERQAKDREEHLVRRNLARAPTSNSGLPLERVQERSADRGTSFHEAPRGQQSRPISSSRGSSTSSERRTQQHAAQAERVKFDRLASRGAAHGAVTLLRQIHAKHSQSEAQTQIRYFQLRPKASRKPRQLLLASSEVDVVPRVTGTRLHTRSGAENSHAVARPPLNIPTSYKMLTSDSC